MSGFQIEFSQLMNWAKYSMIFLQIYYLATLMLLVEGSFGAPETIVQVQNLMFVQSEIRVATSVPGGKPKRKPCIDCSYYRSTVTESG